MDNAEESAAIMPQSERPSLQQVATSESKRNVLDEGLHPSAHHEGKRYSFKMEEPSILISEEDSLINDDDDDDDYAATASSGVLRSVASSVSHTLRSCARSWASPKASRAKPRTMLLDASSENAPCLASKRAVSRASAVAPARRATRSRRRSACIRREAP